ncbi:hypothetical protein DPMN_114025 [Dreissena polymorpha]|uniref:Ufm1-specific protease 2 n=2 Tax=Dreissena polymorpha TaxID=45954 RepID=A0A9D4KIG9_DREPO|nr:hypothetical protein DPMN_114025 [Dreissena polymorpha]
MTTCVKISQKITENCKDINSGCKLVFGVQSSTTSYVLGCVSVSEDPVKRLNYVHTLLPGGVQVLGILSADADPVSKHRDVLNCIDQETSRLIITVKKGQTQIDSVHEFSADGDCVQLQWTLEHIDLPSICVVARTRCQISLAFPLPEKGKWQDSLNTAIENIKTGIASQSTMFRLEQANVLLCSSGCYGLPDDSSIHSLVDMVGDENAIQTRRKEKKQVTLLFEVYTDMCNGCSEKVPSCSPVISYKTGPVKVTNLLLNLDTVTLLPTSAHISDVSKGLSVSLQRQLVAMETCISQHSKLKSFVKPKSYHCKPLLSDCVFSVIYPDSFDNKQLELERKQLHECLCFALDRPLFRRVNRFTFPGSHDNTGGYLVNVHEHVPRSKVTGGTMCCVQGSYTYHHYMQDRFDDNKWGCAYRSLQTLVSWFRLQGYNDTEIPSHHTIQQTLVDIGDKEPSFVGSRKWIGSMEVSFVLDTLLGVTSKILSVSSGAEMSSKGRELQSHFQTQGTPIMIGGGVLAHTILGVDYDEVTGNIAFLILDPHYTGAEELKIIVDKGWCGWKGPDFWDQHAHYNMCLPQRPCVI